MYIHTHRGGFRGWGGRLFSLSGIRPPRQPKDSPFCIFYDIHFRPTDPIFFLKDSSAPIYSNFDGEHAPKNATFWSKFSKKNTKTALL